MACRAPIGIPGHTIGVLQNLCRLRRGALVLLLLLRRWYTLGRRRRLLLYALRPLEDLDWLRMTVLRLSLVLLGVVRMLLITRWRSLLIPWAWLWRLRLGGRLGLLTHGSFNLLQAHDLTTWGRLRSLLRRGL